MRYLVILGVVLLSAGCATTSNGPRVTYDNPSEMGRAAGVGLEGQDIRAMTDQMTRDILSSPAIANFNKPPYIIVDDGYFVNEGSTPINKRLITERLMVELNRASAGRMYFVERQAEDMVTLERKRKRDGEVGAGSKSAVAKVAGADFRLTGRIMTQDVVDASQGVSSRYHQIVFKLVDLESGLAVWTNMYEMKKSGTSDAIYR